MTPSNAEDHLKRVQSLHAHFECLTGNKCALSYMRIAAWHQFIERGFGPQDLADVIKYIRREMARQGSGYSPASLQFSRLVQDTDLFEDRLNLAKQSWRKAAPAPQATETREQHVGNITRRVELPLEDHVQDVASDFSEMARGLREKLHHKQT